MGSTEPPDDTHPEPPARFDDLAPLIRAIEGPLFRIHDTDYDPIYFGKAAKHRFDAPGGEFGVLYSAEDPFAAFIETFGHDTGVRVVTRAALEANPIAEIHLTRPLRVIDLAASGGLARIGADERLCAGGHALAQRWALAFCRSGVDGVAYRCRHDPARIAVAIFETASNAVTAERLGPLSAPTREKLLGAILDTYRFGLLE